MMRKPAFKAQVDTFTANAEVVDQLEVVSKHGVSAFLGSEPQPLTSPASASDVKAHAARAKVDFKFKLEYKSTDLKDPEMIKSAREMMAQAEPAFQVEMQRMMEQPEMRKVVEASRSFVRWQI